MAPRSAIASRFSAHPVPVNSAKPKITALAVFIDESVSERARQSPQFEKMRLSPPVIM